MIYNPRLERYGEIWGKVSWGGGEKERKEYILQRKTVSSRNQNGEQFGVERACCGGKGDGEIRLKRSQNMRAWVFTLKSLNFVLTVTESLSRILIRGSIL